MEMSPSHFYHIANKVDFDAAVKSGSYSCASLSVEGFIHCCFEEQLPGVIERYYRDVTDLLLLTIDIARLEEPVKYENTVGGAELFPHVYGVIDLIAVTNTVELDTSSNNA